MLLVTEEYMLSNNRKTD